MFTTLGLQNFKNFREATLDLGPFTVLVGANASGKSNLRDAFRFLHGIGRGYTFSEILEGKYGEGGEHVWNAIRGGTLGIPFRGEEKFQLTSTTDSPTYRQFDIAVRLTGSPVHAELVSEEFIGQISPQSSSPFRFQHKTLSALNSTGEEIRAKISAEIENETPISGTFAFNRMSTILSQTIREWRGSALRWAKSPPKTDKEKALAFYTPNGSRRALNILRSMRFFDLDPVSLRTPSVVGQNTLGQRGENLASVLMDLCQDNAKKNTLIEWLQILTPMDAKDLQFSVAEHTNEVTLVLIEQDGTETPMQSASDGTLRFLGLLALLFQDDPPKLLFLEEIETGLHPTRLDLLVNLIEQRTTQTDTQVIATTHSPQLLEVLSQDTLEDVQLVYRTEDGPEAQICPLLEVPSARRVLAKPDQRVGDLHQSGWFENAMAFSRPRPVSS
jgi:predicted ATPase